MVAKPLVPVVKAPGINPILDLENLECTWVGMLLPTPTAEWSASLEQPCRKVIPLLQLSFGG